MILFNVDVGVTVFVCVWALFWLSRTIFLRILDRNGRFEIGR